MKKVQEPFFDCKTQINRPEKTENLKNRHNKTEASLFFKKDIHLHIF